MKAVIFGASGQDGHYLRELLAAAQVETVTVSRQGAEVRGDVADGVFVEGILRETRPDYVFHLAARSTTAHDALFENHAAISTGTLNVLESVRNHSPAARVFLAGSAMQFRNEGRPIDEGVAFEASSPYAIARIQSTYAGRYYRERFGLRVFTGFFFNHDSPRRSDQHVNQKIVRTAQRIAAGEKIKLELGDTSVKKEFGFAGDVVDAIWRLVNQEQVHEVVIGTGQAYSIQEWVDYCFGRLGLKAADWVSPRAGFRREYALLVSNPARLRGLGWQPKVGFHQLADLMLAAPRAA